MPYYGHHREANRHPVLRAIAISSALVLAAVAGTVVVTYRQLDANITHSAALQIIPQADRPAVTINFAKSTKPLNILVMGSDSRRGQTAVLGNTPGLSDTTILLHLSADRSRAYGISIPRDLMVSRPSCPGSSGQTIPAENPAQWNAAFAQGGEACTIRQFEAMTHVRVDHFVTVDFNGFIGMVDALNGVPVCIPNDINDDIGRIYLKAGTYTIRGEQALDYVRVRHDVGTTDTGDIGRMKRQQTFMAAMVNKVVSAGTLLNPIRLQKFLKAATTALTIDSGMSLIDLVTIGRQVGNIGLSKVQFFSMPFIPYPPDPNRLAPDTTAASLWQQVRDDKVLGPEFTKDATKASGTKTAAQRADAARLGLCA